MKLKSKKSALLLSFTSLLLCFAMLAGSTFAWFTDTATTGVNKIVAGNLKVDIVDADGRTSLTGEGRKLLWTQKVVSGSDGELKAVETEGRPLWEPGVNFLTQGFKIANKGNLALKWKAQVNKGTTAANEGSYDLLDVIDFYLVKNSITGEETPLAEFTGTLEAKKTSDDVYYIKGVMKKEANNNYQGLTLDGITITVYATQLASEFDSFNNTYDENAEYPIDTWNGDIATDAELAAATDDTNKVVTVESGKLLAALVQSVNGGNDYEGYTIKLTKNLDLKGIEWTPIGVKDGNKFKGVFDGQNRKVLNLKIENGPDYAAFFGAIENATVKNLTVEGSVKGSNVAGIAARVDGSSKVINCTNRATVTGTNKAAGITVKIEANNALLENCVNEGDVSCNTNNGAAGVVVYAQNGKFTIKNCVNNGNVTAPRAGGIVYNVSDNGNGLITGCVNKGNITSDGDKVAGIVSMNSVGTNLTISDCKNFGNISGQDASSICCMEYAHEDGKPNTNSGVISASRIRYISESSAAINGNVGANIDIFIGSTVTISGGEYAGSITNRGVLTIDGGRFTSVPNFFNEGRLTVNSGDLGEIRTNNAGVTEINGGTIAWLGTGATDGSTYTGKLTVNNGKIGGMISLAAGTGTIEIKGGHFTYDEPTQVMVDIRNGAQGTVTISSGEFDWSTEGRFCIANREKLVINGGTFKWN